MLSFNASNTLGGYRSTCLDNVQMFQANGNLPTTTAVNLLSAASTFDLNGTFQTIGSLAGVAGSTVLDSGGLVAGGDNSNQTFAGAIAGFGSFTKTGDGVLTFTGTQSYTGPTAVNAGALAVAAPNALASPSVSVVGGGNLLLSSGITLGSGQTVTLTSTAGALAGIGWGFDPGSLPAIFTDTFGGVYGINTSAFASVSSLGAIDATYAPGGGHFFLGSQSSGTFTGTSLAPASDNVYRLGGGGGTLTIQNGVLSDNTSPASVQIGSTAVNGGGTVILTAANTYTGGTTINAGTLQLGDGAAAIGSVVGSITDNAALVFANPLTQAYAGTISGSGSVTKTGAGMLTLTGSNSYAGATTVNAGTLAFSSFNALGSPTAGNSTISLGGSAPATLQFLGAVSSTTSRTIGMQNDAVLDASGSGGAAMVFDNGTQIVPIIFDWDNGLTLTGSGVGSINSPIFGVAAIVKSGTGTWTLGAATTFASSDPSAGAVTVNGGRLVAAGSGALGTTGPVLVNSSGTLVVNAPSLYTGVTTVTNGQIVLGANNALPPTTLLTLGGSGKIDLAGYNQTVGGLATANAVAAAVGNSTSTTATLNVAGTGTSIFGGTITGATNLAVSGGTLTLTAANSYTGGTSIKNGRLVVSVPSALPALTVLTLGDTGTNGTLDLAGTTQTVAGLAVAGSALVANQVIGNSGAAPAVLNFAGNNTPSTFGGTIQDGLDGGGTTALTVSSGTLTLTGSNIYSGGTSVTGGLLEISSAGALPAGTSLTIGSDAGGVFDAGIGSGTLLAAPLASAATAGPGLPRSALLAVTPASGGSAMAAVPEPGTLGLLAAGLAGWAIATLRRRSRTEN
jgi:autotransporter-associated beta strand protein